MNKKWDNTDLNQLLMEVSQNGQVILHYGTFGITDHAEGKIKSTHDNYCKFCNTQLKSKQFTPTLKLRTIDFFFFYISIRES